MIYVENGALQSAINSAAVGETIMLTEDIALTGRISVSSAVTLDLNGYTITGNLDDSYGAVYVGTKGSLTIKDSSAGQTGGIVNNIKHAIGNYGSVEIYGGTFTGNYALYNFYYGSTIYGVSVIYGGTFKSFDGESLAIANCGNLTVSGGTIESIDTTNTLTVSGGDIESLYIGVADYNPPSQSTAISGGHIVELAVNTESSNEVAVSGGTFDTAIDSQYLVDGFKLTYDASTGTYTATESQGLKVIATSSSRLKDLVIKNGQLIFIQDAGRIAFDFKGKRKFYNQIVELDTDTDRQNMEDPLDGYYFVINTAVLWSYRGGWTQITEKPREIVFIGVEFPELGNEQTIYANTTDGGEYIAVWDEEESDYHVVADRTYAMTSEEVIALFN